MSVHLVQGMRVYTVECDRCGSSATVHSYSPLLALGDLELSEGWDSTVVDDRLRTLCPKCRA